MQNNNRGKAGFCTPYCSLGSDVGGHGCFQRSAATTKFEGILSATSKMGIQENLGQDQYSSENLVLVEKPTPCLRTLINPGFLFSFCE